MNYAFLGLGFVQGWLWLFFLNGPLLLSEAEGWSVNNELILLSFLLTNSLAFLWVTKKTITSTPFYARKLILVTSAFLMAGGVLMVKLSAGQTGEISYIILALSGAVIAGFGSAILIVALGELFSLFSVKVTSLWFGGSVTVGTLLFFGALKLTIPLAFLLIILSPIIALLFIFLGRRQISKTDVTAGKLQLNTFPFPRRLASLIILFNIAGGLFYKLILLSSEPVLQGPYWLTNVIYCLMIVVAGSCLYLFPDLDLSVLYRPVLPLLGAGFMLIPFSPEVSTFLPLTLLQAGFALFDLYTWLLFAYVAKSYQKPAYVFGWGMFLITISIFAGETIFGTLCVNLTFSLRETQILSLCAALLMMIGTMLFHGKRDSFAGWEGPADLKPVPGYMEQSTSEQALINIRETASTLQIVELEHEAPPLLVEAGVSQWDKLEAANNIANTNTINMREQFLVSLELTKRETEVALLLFEGRNNPFIRGILNISNNTLKTHLKNIYRKAAIKDRQQLLDLFNEFVIVQSNPPKP